MEYHCMLVAPRRSCFEYDIVDSMAITEGLLDTILDNVVAVWVQDDGLRLELSGK